MKTILRITLVGALLLAVPSLRADRSAPIIDFSSPAALGQLKPSGDTVTIAAGPEIRIAPGTPTFPGIEVRPASSVFDLSTFGCVQAQVTNTGAEPLRITLRIDNSGSSQLKPWNSEAATVKPGATGIVKVYFGYSFGKESYALNSAAISVIRLFAVKRDADQSFRIDSITAAGGPGDKPPVDPTTVQVVPVKGVLFDSSMRIDAARQLVARGSTAAAEGGVIRATFPASNPNASVTYKPAVGKWDLSRYLQIRAKVKNAGKFPFTPRLSLEKAGPIGVVSTLKPLAPGAQSELVVSFICPTVIDLADKAAKPDFRSDVTGGVIFSAAGASSEQVLEIISITAELVPAAMPAWLGKRPPLEGNWTLTLDENFNGSAINESLWDPKANNYWDPGKTHFTKENLIVANGIARLRYEKKDGYQNDDETKAKTPYAVGYMRGYDKWRQRYGYFESRMKIPTAPGLWPGFWLMPDRGPEAGGGVARQSTENGGMEFDIMENLTRWGPYRYNVALHWDGYAKKHKAIGCSSIYVQPDKDGYITSGLLWLPGKVVFYCNGKELARWENERVADVPAYIIFYMPSGGWDNSPTDDKQFPADYEIDYVRVWQRADLATPADSPKSLN